LAGSGSGGEGRPRGIKAVDFKKGTWEDGNFATTNRGLPFQEREFFFFL
jgi:hypothetical protein